MPTELCTRKPPQQRLSILLWALLRDGADLTPWNIVKAALLLFGASGLLAAILSYLGV